MKARAQAVSVRLLRAAKLLQEVLLTREFTLTVKIKHDSRMLPLRMMGLESRLKMDFQMCCIGTIEIAIEVVK